MGRKKVIRGKELNYLLIEGSIKLRRMRTIINIYYLITDY